MSVQRLLHSARAVLHTAGTPGLFPELSATLLLSCVKLTQSLESERTKDVFFLSREGQFLKMLFDRYQEHHLPADRRIRTHYLCVSRLATFLPSLRTLADEDFFVLFRQYRRISPKEFLESLGLADEVDVICAAAGLDAAGRLGDFIHDGALQKLRDCPLFVATYESARTARVNALNSYLQSYPLAGKADTLHVVDVGWKGSIQDNLWNFLQRNAAETLPFKKVTGHYIGLVAPGLTESGNVKHHLLFSCLHGKTPGFSIYNENRSLFEVVLGADHGGTVAYAMNDAGLGQPILKSSPEEIALFRDRIAPVQRGLVTGFDALLRALPAEDLSSQAFTDAMCQLHRRLNFDATAEEIEWFGTIFHIENFGVFETSKFTHHHCPSWRSRMSFTWRILKKGRFSQDYFWPWLIYRREALPLVASIYALRAQSHDR